MLETQGTLVRLHALAESDQDLAGLDALAIGAETCSSRILTELAQLNDKLAPWNTVPAVADFCTAMKDTVLHQV